MAIVVLLLLGAVIILPVLQPKGDSLWGGIYLGVILSQADAKVVIGALLAIVSVGSAFAGKAKTPNLRIYASIALCIAGLLICAGLWVIVDQPGIAQPLWAYSPFDGIQSSEGLLTAHHRFLVVVSGWLGAQLLAMLAIKATDGSGG
ncbi:hypothetical protein HL653_12720 [Sphingomonas sp. AP4-R1]|uniref:hypothetical protein n=1 Tax=Sphingomonas sp. AP4-R1 TaxID=2735134 RepID=UPI001493B723|nr:hypothetical protein [Sphingomonas sp. AP4-R1]QJU58512.1 hypothetical protein HL653_12720 [Sphingomonas sp. AP4-R1]